MLYINGVQVQINFEKNQQLHPLIHSAMGYSNESEKFYQKGLGYNTLKADWPTLESGWAIYWLDNLEQ